MKINKILKYKNRETKNPFSGKRFFGVDPAGFTPASSGANADMLLHSTTGPGPQINFKIKKALFQEPLLFST